MHGWDEGVEFGLFSGQYQTSIENKVDFEAILDNQSEFEIGKVGLLFLTSSLLCVNNAVFVERATNLDVRVQHEIRVMVEHVIQPNHQLIGLDSSFSMILGNPLSKYPSLFTVKSLI